MPARGAFAVPVSEIVRIAARGDGVTADGRHIARGVPDDRVNEDGSLEHGPHHVKPPCRHFERCGGCQLQHADEAVLRQFVTERVVLAAEGQGLEAGRVASPHLSPPKTRRRATLHGANGGGRALLGYKEARSHRIVDLAECPVLHPTLFALVTPLRLLLARQGGRYAATIALSLTDQGVDCALTGVTFEGLEANEALTSFARDHKLARLALDMGYGPETMWEPEPVTVTLSGVPVGFPQGAFMQATADGEAALADAVREWLGGARHVADLFSGLGTFAFALSETAHVSAYEAARDAHLACRVAAGRHGARVMAHHRDLFRQPLETEELAGFDAVVLDPPRAGAKEQVARIAQSEVERIAYIGCNPASWSRDAARLVDGGYRLAELRPVGQFRWSTHVELASLFVR